MLILLAWVLAVAQPLTQGVLFEGRVHLACRATAEGGVEDCRVAREHPEGRGYGAQALGTAANLRLPPDPTGKRKAGDRVVVPFQFKSAPAGAPLGGDVPISEPLQLAAPRAPMRWVRRPTSLELERVFKATVAPGLKAGRATMRCNVRPDGVLEACAVIGEQPTGYGMGAAALAAHGFFRAGPPDGADRIADGATVVVPIIFVRE